MTCGDVRRFLKQEGKAGDAVNSDKGLSIHLESCRRCSEAVRTAGLSSTLLDSLRQEIEPGPFFYTRLQARLAEAAIGQPEATLLHALGMARRLIPALAMGVLLLAGITFSIGGQRSSLPVHVRGGSDVHAFSLEEVNLPGVVGQPSRDQMLAFVLREGMGPAPDTDPGHGVRR